MLETAGGEATRTDSIAQETYAMKASQAACA